MKKKTLSFGDKVTDIIDGTEYIALNMGRRFCYICIKNPTGEVYIIFQDRLKKGWKTKAKSGGREG